ncbi:hypothetical protein HMI55_006511 [Coelomomyces lativittatus]|nr:hypothetical protein HMI55_006511 [Coelomomyces lativittatus]
MDLFFFSQKPTGYPGIPQHPHPHQALTDWYTKTLLLLKELPETSLYRQATLQLTQSRLDLVNKNSDRATLAKELGESIEFSLDQAEAEFELVQQMQQWKAWEPLSEKAVEGQWTYPISEKKIEQR